MAAGTTMFHLAVDLSDVDRGVYETLELHLARHPSETPRWLVTRALAYCLAFEEGIAFSKGGLSDVEEPALSIRDATGALRAWIEIGQPSADRLHKAAKAAPRVLLFTTADPRALRREVQGRKVHRLAEIEVWRLDPGLVDGLAGALDRRTSLSLSRNDGHLYAEVGGRTHEGAVQRVDLAEPETP